MGSCINALDLALRGAYNHNRDGIENVLTSIHWLLLIVYRQCFRKREPGVSAELQLQFREMYQQEYEVMDLIDERYVLLLDQSHMVQDEDQRLVRHRCDGWTKFIDFLL